MNRMGTRALALGAVAVFGLVAGGGQSVGQDRGDAPRAAVRAADRAVAEAQGRGVAGGHSHPLGKSDIPWSGSPSPFEAQIKLADGRRVAMYYLRDKGLFVQDYSPVAKGWSAPAVVYGTATDACQGITLKAKDGTVAAFGDFGTYCADGEPPTESVAAVAVGPLTTWDKHVTKNFDGWEKIVVAPGGKKVTFSRGAQTLRWTKAAGFPVG